MILTKKVEIWSNEPKLAVVESRWMKNNFFFQIQHKIWLDEKISLADAPNVWRDRRRFVRTLKITNNYPKIAVRTSR